MSGPERSAGDGPAAGRSGDLLERIFRNGGVNALLSWALVGVLGVAVIESVLDADYQWIAFVAAAVASVVLPPIAYRNWRVMLPWELLGLLSLPVLVRGLFGGTVGAFATYFALATLALVVAVELHTFTPLELTHWFAVALVVLTTLASAATWAIVRWHFDRLLGTAYLSTNRALMREFLRVALAGLGAGALFDVYFRWRDRRLWRVIQAVIR